MEKKLVRISASIHLANQEKGDCKAVDERPVYDGKATRETLNVSADRASHGMVWPSSPKLQTFAGFEPRLSDCAHQMVNYSMSECDSSSLSSSSCSSSACTFEEFSISCTSESSVSAKGEWSPASVTTTQCRPLKPTSRLRVRTSLRSHFEATPVEKWDPTDIDGMMHVKPRPQTQVTLHTSKEDGFLEFSFHDGTLVENQLCPHVPDGPSSCTSSILMVSDEVTAVEKLDTTSFDISDEEWADGSSCNPVFYSASARSLESCSETSYHPGEASTLPSVEVELDCAPRMNESSFDCGQLHLAQVKECSSATPEIRKHVVRPIEEDGHGKLRPEALSPSTSQMFKDLECNSAPLKAENGVDRVFPEPEAQSRKSSSNIAPNAHRHEEGFSFQPAPLWRPPKSKGRSTSCSPVFSKVAVLSKGRNMDHQTLADMVLMQSKGLHRKGGLERQPLSSLLFDRHFSTVHPHDKEKAIQTVQKMVSVSRSSEPLSLSSTKYSEKADEFTPVFPPLQARGKKDDEFSRGEVMMGSLRNGSQVPKVRNAPASCSAPMDWRSKSLGARASLRSAVRNLEAALGGSRSVSLPKTRSNASQKDAKTESLRLLDRVFVSPMKSRLKPADMSRGKPPNPAVRLLQAQDVMRREMRGRKDAMLGSQMRSVNQLPPRPAIIFKHNALGLEISCKPALPASRGVHSAASQLRVPDLLPSRSSSASPAMQQGCLQCVLRNGAPFYTLTLDGFEDVFVARSCALENHSSKDGCKWMYTFESVDSKARRKGTGGWKNWRRKDHKSSSDLSGKMQVSTVLLPEASAAGGTTHSVLSEFVLFDGRVEDTVRSQSLRFWSSDNTCPINPTSSSSEGSPLSASHASSGFFSPPSSSTSSDKKFLASPSSLEEGSDTATDPHSVSPVKGSIGHRPSFSLDMRSGNDLACSDVGPVSPCPPHMELAAMVIRLQANEHGRMLKVGNACSRTNNSILKIPYEKSKYAQPSSAQIVDNPAKAGICHGTRSSVTLLLPKGDHSLPNEGQCGPSSLIQRWRSGGKCECGGWDMGCGLRVFSSDSKGNYARNPAPLSLSPDMPLSILSQGCRPEVMLTLSAVQEGLFVLSFHSHLTLLRAFATAVAILHSKHSLAATETWARMGSPKEGPPHPPHLHYSSLHQGQRP